MAPTDDSPRTATAAGPLLTVVIASRCDDARSELLIRACDSVRKMADGLEYGIVVVANGARVSPTVIETLRTRPDVRIIRIPSGSHPLARRIGAEFSASEFLAFLDDDDELVPATLAPKVRYFREHPDVDVLVTDGYSVSRRGETRIFPRREDRSPDLIETMMCAGWGAGAITVRTARVDLAAFDAEFRHLEWTLTVLLLAARYKVGYLDEVTYRYYEDTPNSLSKALEHAVAAPEVWRRLSVAYAGSRYEARVRRRYGRECHNVAAEYASRRQFLLAWSYHLKSLAAPGGMQMLPFSLRLLFITLFRRGKRQSPDGHGRAVSGTAGSSGGVDPMPDKQ